MPHRTAKFKLHVLLLVFYRVECVYLLLKQTPGSLGQCGTFAMLTKGQLALKSVRLLEAPAINRYSNTRHFHYLSRPLRSCRISTSRSIQLTPSPTLRFASTSRGVAIDAQSPGTRLKNLFLGSAIGLFLLVGYYYVTDTRAGIHQWIVVPSLRWIYDDAEEAHEVGTKALKDLYGFGLHPRERGNGDAVGDLKVEVRSRCFPETSPLEA